MLVALANIALSLVVLLEVTTSLESEVRMQAPVTEASLVCSFGSFCLMHLCPSGAVCGIVPIVAHVQAASILASGVQDLADAAVIVSGATGVNLVSLGLPGVASKVLHVVVAAVGSLCSTADLGPTLKSGAQFFKSGSG